MIRIAYFQTRPGQEDTEQSYDVDLAPGESIVSVERELDGGYNTNWHRVYIVSVAAGSDGETETEKETT